MIWHIIYLYIYIIYSTIIYYININWQPVVKCHTLSDIRISRSHALTLWERGDQPGHPNDIRYHTLSPIIMEVENGYTWKVTTIGGANFWLPWLWGGSVVLILHHGEPLSRNIRQHWSGRDLFFDESLWHMGHHESAWWHMGHQLNTSFL